MMAELTQLFTHQTSVAAGFYAGHLDFATSKFEHLKGAGEKNELLNMLGNELFRTCLLYTSDAADE